MHLKETLLVTRLFHSYKAKARTKTFCCCSSGFFEQAAKGLFHQRRCLQLPVVAVAKISPWHVEISPQHLRYVSRHDSFIVQKLDDDFSWTPSQLWRCLQHFSMMLPAVVEMLWRHLQLDSARQHHHNCMETMQRQIFRHLKVSSEALLNSNMFISTLTPWGSLSSPGDVSGRLVYWPVRQALDTA